MKPLLRTAYLQAMAGEWSTLPLEVLDPKASVVDTATRRLTLERVYPSLNTTTQRPGVGSLRCDLESLDQTVTNQRGQPTPVGGMVEIAVVPAVAEAVRRSFSLDSD